VLSAPDFGNPFGDLSAAPPPRAHAPNLLDDAPAASALNSLAPQLAAALPGAGGAGWPAASPVKLSREGPRLGEELRTTKKADPFASLIDL
jgi:hypothetical protein